MVQKVRYCKQFFGAIFFSGKVQKSFQNLVLIALGIHYKIVLGLIHENCLSVVF